ncbi:hypothetical protein [Thermomicrobium sp.]|uniref:hypothetical protein n=1 Tax=Thermomicrobium sp. TaxID=1969469 RepID=UPI001B0F514A|nr:hypothetical protein [Thermomicrobium sp.]MBO9307126.1 hypothetical protein [Thermomicrobium sp.]MBO9359031.1 hypothetical protein [Thermomicrobium sp.]
MESREPIDCWQELGLPFPPERLRGRLVPCPQCSAPLALMRRRRFYALCATVEETSQGAVLICRQCGARQPVRELLLSGRRARTS